MIHPQELGFWQAVAHTTMTTKKVQEEICKALAVMFDGGNGDIATEVVKELHDKLHQAQQEEGCSHILAIYTDWLKDQGEDLQAELIAECNGEPGSGFGEFVQKKLGRQASKEVEYAVCSYVVENIPTPRLNKLGLVCRLKYFRAIVHWFRRRLAKAVAEQRRQDHFRQRAKDGDTSALLAFTQGRESVIRLVEGKKQAGITEYTSSRRAIAEAKEKMAQRLERRTQRRIAEQARQGEPNRIRIDYFRKLRELAVRIGEHYHQTTQALYRSQWAGVAYGRGGQEGRNYDGRSRRIARLYGPNRFRNAGARLDNEDHPTTIILESHLGRVIARIPLAEARTMLEVSHV